MLNVVCLYYIQASLTKFSTCTCLQWPWLWPLTLILLNNLISHTHIWLPANQITQGLTNPLPSCPGQVQILAGQVIFYFTCPEKCIEYIGNIVIPSHFQDAVECRASGWNLDLSGPVTSYNFLFKFTNWITNSVDLDQMAFSEAIWSGSTLFAKVGLSWTAG